LRSRRRRTSTGTSMFPIPGTHSFSTLGHTPDPSRRYSRRNPEMPSKTHANYSDGRGFRANLAATTATSSFSSAPTNLFQRRTALSFCPNAGR
jgi:hypothetical protein